MIMEWNEGEIVIIVMVMVDVGVGVDELRGHERV
jgi:hypothetical protein